MEDLSHWEFAKDFSGAEAAMLIVGLDPTRLSVGDARPGKLCYPILERMKKDYNEAERHADFETLGLDLSRAFKFPERSLISLDLHAVADAAFLEDNVEAWTSKGLIQVHEFFRRYSNFDDQRFSRKQIQDWLTANELVSKYRFGQRADRNPSKVALREELLPKERVTATKLIAGLAMLHKVDIHSPRLDRKRLHIELQEVGVEVDDDTLSKWLKMAADAVPARR